MEASNNKRAYIIIDCKQKLMQPSNRFFSGENKTEIRNNGMIAIRKAIPIKPQRNIM